MAKWWFKKSPIIPTESVPSVGDSRTGSQTKIQTSYGDNFLDKVPKMRANPTIALARATATAPIKSAQWTFRKKEGVPDDRLKSIQRAMDPLMRELIRHICYALDYGFKPFEIIWGYPEDANILAPVKFKPLSVKETKVVLNKTTEKYDGLKNKNVILAPEYTLWYTHDKEDDNYYGRSRLRNVETSYDSWARIANRQLQYIDMVASPVPIMEYPPGKSLDANGIETPNYEIAARMLSALSSGKGIYMPNDLVKAAREFFERGVDLQKLRAWHISFLEARAAHGNDFVEQARHHESCMMRGYLVPERSAVEGQFGTKAEASTHVELALSICEEVTWEIASVLNWYVMDRICAFNWGDETRGTIWIEPVPIVNEQHQFLKETFGRLLGSNADLFRMYLDVDQVLRILGLPKASETITQDALEPDEPVFKDSNDVSDDDTLKDNTLTAALDRVYAGLLKSL